MWRHHGQYTNKLARSFLQNENGKCVTQNGRNVYRGSVFYHECLEYLSHKILKHRRVKAQVKVRFPWYKSLSKKGQTMEKVEASLKQMARGVMLVTYCCTPFILIGSGIVTICAGIYVCNKVPVWINEKFRHICGGIKKQWQKIENSAHSRALRQQELIRKKIHRKSNVKKQCPK